MTIVRDPAGAYLRRMEQQDVLSGVIEWLVATVVIVATLGSLFYLREWRRLLVRIYRWVRPLPPPPVRPLGRPIESIARDAQRLGARFRNTPPGLSFAKFEGLRRAYDDVLGEGCRALGVENLMTPLRPGPERDAERLRVEFLLAEAGLGRANVA